MPPSTPDDAPVAFQDPQYREAVIDLLAAIAYGEISAFERLAEDAKLAPTLEDKVAIASMAAAQFPPITDPNKEVASGYGPNIMPQDFGTRMTEEEINGLVAWLLDPNRPQ